MYNESAAAVVSIPQAASCRRPNILLLASLPPRQMAGRMRRFDDGWRKICV